MLILDTDHVSELGYATAQGLSLRERLLRSGDAVCTTIITVEEQLRGWLAEIHRHPDPHKQIPAYKRLGERIEFFNLWTILHWDAEAAERFLSLRREGLRIGTMDQKIAAIALCRDGILLTRNAADFSRVPGLQFEDWLSG